MKKVRIVYGLRYHLRYHTFSNRQKRKRKHQNHPNLTQKYHCVYFEFFQTGVYNSRKNVFQTGSMTTPPITQTSICCKLFCSWQWLGVTGLCLKRRTRSDTYSSCNAERSTADGLLQLESRRRPSSCKDNRVFFFKLLALPV